MGDMMDDAPQIVVEGISRDELRRLAEGRFGDLVKGVVDIGRGIMAIGGSLHADEEQVLLDDGSRQEDLWGINFYPDRTDDDWVEFDSVINIRPRQGNRSRGVDDPATRDVILRIVSTLVKE